jgi:hypothetical protein
MSQPENFTERTATAALIDFLRDRLLSIVGLLLLAVGAVMLLGFDVTIPRWTKLAGFTALAFVPAGWFLGSWLLGLLYSPDWTFLVDLDAGKLDGALYRLPPEDFRELEVTDESGNSGAPYDITQLTQNLYAAKQVDIDELTCVGTWRGTLDDRELARSLRKVRECRGQLQDDAQKGFVLETSAFTIVRRAARETALDVTEMFETGTLPDSGDSITNAVDRALEDFGFEDTIENIDDDLGNDHDDDQDDDQSEDERRRDSNGAESPTAEPIQTND